MEKRETISEIKGNASADDEGGFVLEYPPVIYSSKSEVPENSNLVPYVYSGLLTYWYLYVMRFK